MKKLATLLMVFAVSVFMVGCGDTKEDNAASKPAPEGEKKPGEGESKPADAEKKPEEGEKKPAEGEKKE